jgi:cysteine synthase
MGILQYFVAGMGTIGTLMGTGKRLKEFNKDIKDNRGRARFKPQDTRH